MDTLRNQLGKEIGLCDEVPGPSNPSNPSNQESIGNAVNDSIKQEYNKHFNNQCYETSLREQIISQRMHCESEARKNSLYARLMYLIDKNPQVFEMIEILRKLHL